MIMDDETEKKRRLALQEEARELSGQLKELETSMRQKVVGDSPLRAYCGTLESLWKSIASIRRLDKRTLYVYSVKTPDVYVWSSREQSPQVQKALGLTFCESRTVYPTVKQQTLSVVHSHTKSE